mgnify:CR=1 FL=1
MCELFCLSSRLRTRVTFSLRKFADRGGLGSHNVDGWGVAFHDGREARLYKEPEPAGDSAGRRLLVPIRGLLQGMGRMQQDNVLRSLDLRLDDGQWLAATAVVLANGIQATELCPELPIEPKKGHLLITDRYPGKVTHTLVELGYVTSAHNASGPSAACNIQPRPTGQLFIGASRQFGTTDPQVEGWMLARMLKRATEYVPALAQLNAIRAWTGFRAASPDGLPLVGQHPQRPGLWLAVGHEGLGVTTAPATADLLAAQLFDETAPLAADAYLPHRFLGEPTHA